MILLFGPPGSGKSLQAQQLQEDGLVHWFSVGELLRERLADENEKAKMQTGNLVSDEVIAQILNKAITEADDQTPVLLDGYPRSQSQIPWLFSPGNPRKIKGIIRMVAPDEELVKRLMLRGRADDNEAVVKHRLDLYHEQTLPLIDELSVNGIPVVEVNADQSIEAVHEEVKKAFHQINDAISA